jgi:hypothetical protein
MIDSKVNEIKRLRAELDSNARLRLEFLGQVSRLLREHSVSISDRLLSELTLASAAEMPEARGAKPPVEK